MSSHLLPVSTKKLIKPLALIPDTQITIESGWDLAVPNWLIEGGESKWRYIEETAKNFGFNALVIGALWKQRLTGHKEITDSFKNCLRYFSRSSLKLFLAPEGQPCENLNSFIGLLEKLQLEEMSIVWISRVLDPKFQNALLEKSVMDALNEEVNELVRHLSSRPWVFAISFLHPFLNHFVSSWIESLDRMLPKEAMIAFSATAVSPFTDFEKVHPFLEKLKRQTNERYPRFLPMINAGAIGYGEGLWPSLSWDIFHKMYELQNINGLSGWISFTRHIPSIKTILGAQFHIMGEMQNKAIFPERCLEIWAEKEDFKLDFDGIEFLKKTRELSLKATLLKQQAETSSSASDYFLYQAEEILAGVKLLKRWDGLIDPLWQKTAVLFTRDIRRFVWHALSLKQLSFTHLLTQDDHENGFWTSLSTPPRLGSPYPKVQFPSQPDFSNLDLNLKQFMQLTWSEDSKLII